MRPYKSIVILGNGSFPERTEHIRLINESDILICCDGAFAKLLSHDETAERIHSEREYYITGDLDSLPEAYRKSYKENIIHCPDQDTNDQTKSFLLARNIILQDTGKYRITFLGATGLREDHTIANISLLMEYACYDIAARCEIEMLSDYCRFIPLTDSCSIECGEDRAISVFSPDRDLNIVSEGLKWQTDGVVFDNWWKATLNKSTQKTVTLKLSHRSKVLISIGLD